MFAKHWLRTSSRIGCPRETGAGQMPVGVGTAESRRRGTNAGLDVYYAQDPVPSGQSLKDVGLSVGFVSHWF